MAPRPRIQRAFLAWLEEAGPRFAIPVRIEKRNDRWLDLSFVGLTPVLSAALTRDEINVGATWEGTTWDLLISLDVGVTRAPGGSACSMCEPAARRVFLNREALRKDHLFEPFLEWVNTELAPKAFLALVRFNGATWASLLPNEQAEDGAVAVVPLRSDGG